MVGNYLVSIAKQFHYYKLLGEKTFEQLTDEELFWQYHPDTNSVAILANRLWGNMKSRWTDFLITDGEKEWRERDKEFEVVIKTRSELLQKWEDGWSCLFEALDSINEENFDNLVYIRNQGHTIIEAINRQLAHYAYHVGQIVQIGKMLKGNEWQSLSIPKGQSKTFNKEKFEQEKARGHFTDEFLEHKRTTNEFTEDVFTPDQIREISEDLQIGMIVFVNKKTGKILSTVDELAHGEMEGWEEVKEEISEQWADLEKIEKMYSRDAFRIMEDFIDEVYDQRLKNQLINALNRRKPFRNFKNIVEDSEYRQHWFKFRDQRHFAWVKNQLKGIELDIKSREK